jgi:hypothetical protein
MLNLLGLATVLRHSLCLNRLGMVQRSLCIMGICAARLVVKRQDGEGSCSVGFRPRLVVA